MIADEDRARIDADPFAKELEALMAKYGKEVFLALGIGEDSRGFSMAKGTGAHIIALLVSFAVSYEEVFQSFMMVFTTLAIEAGRSESSFEKMIDEKLRRKKEPGNPAVMASARF